ncbi:cyclin-domain-containing protein [Mycena leptocephala]|nr:cyclin-domain-containing protein [Mycena leptocephala]
MLALVPAAHDKTSCHCSRPSTPSGGPTPGISQGSPSRPQDQPRARTDPPPPAPPPPQPAPAPFDVHSYPSPELLRLLASLLAQIAATNDKLDAVTPATPPSTTPTRTTLATVTPTDAPIWRTLTTASRTAISTPSSVLTFHARNVPTISLEAYLLRILKYCPTTNELSSEATGRTFVIDSYNIHRLVIAGVTVASKFFSDVFYTNSRYAKLNQLELQFLLLNDFRLVIPRDEMQRYAEQLILFSNAPDAVPPAPVAAPMQAMGAIDAYGGRVPTQQRPARHRHSPMANKTPSFRPRAPPDNDDTETETETETEGTETDGGWTTDDEPTIRPAHSSAGSSSDDTRSLSSADDTGDEGDDEAGDGMEGVEGTDGGGGRGRGGGRPDAGARDG